PRRGRNGLSDGLGGRQTGVRGQEVGATLGVWAARRCAWLGDLGDGRLLDPLFQFTRLGELLVATVCCYSWVFEEGGYGLDCCSNLSVPLMISLLSKGQTSSLKIFIKIASY